jgi:hypothetical protein
MDKDSCAGTCSTIYKKVNYVVPIHLNLKTYFLRPKNMYCGDQDPHPAGSRYKRNIYGSATLIFFFDRTVL